MDIENLTRYDIEADCTVVPMNGSMYPRTDGEYVKFEEAVEASSNSLQQLKAEIASLCDEMEGACYPDHYGMRIETFLSKLRELSAV